MGLMIEIPDTLFQPEIIRKGVAKVILYTLDVNTIGISSKFIPEWGKSALYLKTILAQKRGTNWVIKPPRRVTRFYLFDRKTRQTVSVNGGSVLITITR